MATTMRYRALTATGDYTFGQNQQDFIFDIYACAQAIKTRLQLYKEAFWRDLTDGLPLFQSILGSPGSAANLLVVDQIIKQRILGTPHVVEILSYSSAFNPNTRGYSFRVEVLTDYSAAFILEESL